MPEVQVVLDHQDVHEGIMAEATFRFAKGLVVYSAVKFTSSHVL